ncbi:MFS transporter [Actinorhabdospora filicis]|uniref:MFS transporter n=1 Tax=Actinorhabdospora filicis TaxID=1785913 RepID=A0A9W6W8T7_9ACTN|nr:MFS transporter [Actinorhabdospora filicis]GLZ77318.1 MFS transporter [Actinorhabdospora filicis]
MSRNDTARNDTARDRTPLPLSFWLIWTALLVNKLGGFVMVMMTLYLTNARDLDPGTAGLVVGAHGAGAIGGMLTGGVLADRIGRKKTIVLSMFATTAALLVLAFVANVFAIAALVTVLGFVSVMAGPAAIAAIADVVVESERSRAFNVMYWAQNLGMGAAVLLGGFLASYSFTLLFVLDAVGAAAAGLLVLLGVRESLARSTPGRPVDRGSLGVVLKDRPYMVFVGLTFVLALLFAQSSSIVPLAMTADGLSEKQFGTALAVGTVLVVLGQLAVPRLIDRWRKAPVLAVAFVLIGVGYGGLALADGFGPYVGCVVVWTIGSMLAAPPNATIIAELSPGPMRGRYQGVFNVTFAAAALVAPSVGGFSLQYLGDWHWPIVGLLGVAAGIGHLVTGPAREKAVRDRLAVTGVARVSELTR